MSPAQEDCTPTVNVSEPVHHTLHVITALAELCYKNCTCAGASHLHVEAAIEEAGVLLNNQTGTEMARLEAALELLQVRDGLGHACQKHALCVI